MSQKILVGTAAVIALVSLGMFASGRRSGPLPNTSTPMPARTSNQITTSQPTAAPLNRIIISGFAYSKPSLTVHVGDTVSWTNGDQVAHTVTNTDSAVSPLSSGTLAPGSTFYFTFTKAGTFGYHCAIHPTMAGTVIVE